MDQESLNQLSRVILTLAIKVHSKLGPGLLESVYRTCLIHELRTAGFNVVAEQIVPVFYGDLQLDDGYRLDMLVNDSIIVEIKAVERLLPVHAAQLLSSEADRQAVRPASEFQCSTSCPRSETRRKPLLDLCVFASLRCRSRSFCNVIPSLHP
jgi:GxxExxY protein